MSDFRTKAREIKAAGEAERGNFAPSGVPLRIYNYWLTNSLSTHAREVREGSRKENFCHFWRVVVIWALALRVGLGIIKFVESKAGMYFTIGLAIAGVIVALYSMEIIVPVLIVAGSIVAFAVLAAGVYYAIRRFWNSDWNDRAAAVAGWAGGFVCAAGILFVLTVLVIEEGWIALVILAGILVGSIAVGIGGFVLSDYISGKRALAREKQMRAEEEAWNNYLATGGPMPGRVAPRQPGMVSKFFSGLADFLILAAQIVRVKKWKICPTVSID